MPDDPQQEFDLVEHTHAKHARTLLVDWMLGNSCSYACSYCPKSLHDGSIRWQTSDAVISFYDQLHDHYVRHRGRRVWLQFTGGEPTMHPQIIRLLEEASLRGFSVSLISNASRTLRFWEKIAPYLDAVILTYHNEFAELDHFLGVCGIVAPRMPVHINVTMHPDRFDKTLAEAQSLRDALPGTTFSLKPLRIDFRTVLYDYTTKQREVMQQGLANGHHDENAMPRATMTVRRADEEPEVLRANELVMRNINQWKGYRCNAGLESLRLTGDGTVTRAVCSVGGPIGRLGKSVTLPCAPIECSADTCGCVSDILITKTRSTARNSENAENVRKQQQVPVSV